MITLASASRFEKIDIFISSLSESLSADLIVQFVQESKVQIRARQWWWDEELWGADQMRSAMKDSIWTRLAEERENEENIWEKDNFGVLEADMIFVENFTQPDFQAKSFTQQKWVICEIFLAN